jgi:microcystin-dependent protein
MASIEEQIKNARTIEDIVNLLSILFTNLNNQNEMYYDMFLNPTPMTLDLERYNENGELVTVTLNNRAKDLISAYSGPGNPNGSQVANIGALYIDTNTRDIYYKATGSDSYGWQLVWTTANLVQGTDYLAPNGDGSLIQNLNANNITSGTVPVIRGGTGVRAITGIVKGNGTSAFTPAVVDEDYLAPSSFTGLIMYCPMEEIPEGWLICNDTIYDVTVRPELTRLKNKLGNKYGGDGVTTFGVPNLMEKYVKGGNASNVGTTGEGNVGEHSHNVTGSTDLDGAHTHTRGSMNITGAYRVTGNVYSGGTYFSGAFYDAGSAVRCEYQDDNRRWSPVIGFSADRSWTGETSATPHQHNINISISSGGAGKNDVDHIVLIPIIKY